MALAIGDLPGLLLGFLPSVQSAGGLSLCAPNRCPPELQSDYRMRIGQRESIAGQEQPAASRQAMISGGG